MSMGFGEDNPVEPDTMHGRTWPSLRQFGVFMENRVGCLHDLLRQVERHDLRVAALSIVDSVDHAVARLILNNYERGLELLNFSNQKVFETDVLGVELPDVDQPYTALCAAMMKAELNIYYIYPMQYRGNGRGGAVMHVDEIDEALRVLKSSGLNAITENDLMQDDEFFG